MLNFKTSIKSLYADTLLYSSITITPWDGMRNRWIRCAGKRHKAESVKRYFNTFSTKHPGYTFIVAKKFNDLYDVCVTAQQCSEIKRHLEREFGLTGYLDEAPSQEVFRSNCTEKSFRNSLEFRQYRENTLLTMNRPAIRAKHADAKQHYDKVKDAFTKGRSAFQILCFDIEVYEHDRSVMLEIGYVICRFTPAPSHSLYQTRSHEVGVVTKRHLIVRENLHYKNGDNVPDNRQGFRFGASETMSIAEAVRR